MTSHRQIMVNAATAVKNDASVLAYCQQHFGRGLEIVVGAYAGTEDGSGIPSEAESPFLWIFAGGENEMVAADQTFTMHAVLGGCVKDESGSQVVSAITTERTASANGLTVNGGNKIVEDLRDTIIGIIIGATCGAYVSRVRKTENDLSHFPLEWAEFEVDFTDYEML